MTTLPTCVEAHKGREEAIISPGVHTVLGSAIDSGAPDFHVILLGMGCFWGAERLFWKLEGIHTTAVGYAGGFTKNPTYEEVCSGLTAHTEVVRVAYAQESLLPQILKTFWENHDPSAGMRQGNDIGTQYRSAIYCSSSEQLQMANETRAAYQAQLAKAGHPPVTTEVATGKTFYFAEEYHQQYLDKKPNGYCGIKGTGVACII